MTSPGARPMVHQGPGGPMPNAYRPQVMSPSINPSGPRMYMTNSPGVRITDMLVFCSLYGIFRLDILPHLLLPMG